MTALLDLSAPTIRRIIEDPSASDWLRRTAREALRRDPVDAANDMHILAKALEHRADHVLARHPALIARMKRKDRRVHGDQ